MGNVHYNKANYDKAQEAFSDAGKIYKQSSSKIAHDALEQSLMKAEYFIKYGNFLSNRKLLTEAQKQYSEALKLYESILPENDPKLMQTYIYIMLAYAQNKKYDNVTKLFEDSKVTKLIDRQEINMFELSSSVTLESLALLHEFVGACYAKQKTFDKAIDLWTRNLVFKRKTRLEQLLLQTTNSYSSTLMAEQKTLLSEGYDEARKYYESSKNEICESNDGTITDFPLGLLYAESYSRDKAIACLTEATPSLRQSKSDKLYAVYLLLGDMYKQQHEYKKAVKSFDQALPLIKSLKNQRDRVLEIEVELARSDCLARDDQSRNAIDDLKKLAESLKSNDTDTKRISLKVIVYDTLALYYLKEKKYELFDNIAEESMILKLRSFSQYHPSLAINLILIAERHSQEFHYHDALYFYEQALEVQCLNFTNNHPKIKKIFYAIGDIYCKIDKLSNAMEKYDVAENKNSSTDDNDVTQQDKLNSEESIEILMARISMYRHLAEFHANKQVYKEAISQMNKIIDLLKEELSSSIFEISDETILIKQSFDQATVLGNLRQLASCYMHLGDILDFEQEDQKGYKEALIIYEKLFQYEKESARAKLVLINKKLSNYYEKLGEDEDALDYLQETIELEEPTIAILYRLGHLNFSCDNLDEAERNYKKILLKQSANKQTTLRQIIQEKLDEVQKEVNKSQRCSSTSSSESVESEHNNTASNSSNTLSRNATNASITSGQRSELNQDINADNKVDSSDYRAMAAAYFELGDDDMSIKYYKKYIKKRRMPTLNTFGTQLQKIEQATYIYEQQSMLPLLPKLFHCLVTKIREDDNLEKSATLDVADSLFQCALVHERSSSHIESIVAYIAAFDLYISKSISIDDKLIGDMTSTLNWFVECRLKPKDFLDICKQYLSRDDVVQMRLKIAAMYRNDEMDDAEDTDDDDDTNDDDDTGSKSREIALQYYKKIVRDDQGCTDMARCVCYYNILRLYKDFIYEDDDGKAIIDDMINWLPKFTISDRRLLVALAFEFLKEYDNNKDSCDRKINRQLQKIAKSCFDEKSKADDELCIGHSLIELDDLVFAEDYWNSLTKQLECDIASRVLSLVHDPQSKLEQILHEIKPSESDKMALFDQLTKAYETIGDYYTSGKSNGQITDIGDFRKAEIMYRTAVNLLKRLKAEPNTIKNVEEKQQKAASEANKLSQSSNK